ncbi:MAG TPA: hypothetical protein PK347_01740 [Burkholderiaceae bacterium]|nr:hypothetical protein [Burkholderiaceae bacterium]
MRRTVDRAVKRPDDVPCDSPMASTRGITCVTLRELAEHAKAGPTLNIPPNITDPPQLQRQTNLMRVCTG